ncbi:MAG: DUF222 domain-containing protein [Sandaracinaceae bacterium]
MLNACAAVPEAAPIDMGAVEAELATLEATINSAIHRRLELIRLIDESGHWAQQGSTSCAHWLSWRLGIQASTAREQVRVATKLKELPRLDEELKHGRVTYSQVRAITRGATPASEEALIDLAKHSTAAQLEKVVRGVEQARAAEDPVGAQEAMKRWVFQRALVDGSHRIEAQLSGDQATLVMEAIRTVQARMREEQRGDLDSEVELPRPSLADALVRMAEQVDATIGDGAAGRSGADRAAIVVHFAEDRLAALTASSAEGASAEGRERAAGARAEVSAGSGSCGERGSKAEDRDRSASAESGSCGERGLRSVDRDGGACAESGSCGVQGSRAEDRDGDASAESGSCGEEGSRTEDRDGDASAESGSCGEEGSRTDEGDGGASAEAGSAMRWAAMLDDGSRLSAETFRRVACDCSLIGVKVDGDGDPLDVGRKTRSIPPALWRAIVLRDKGCAFPGCTHDRYLDGHHIEHWANGGETKKGNLVCLCSMHHQLVHEGGFRVEVDALGRAAFFDRSGARLRVNGWTGPERTVGELRSAMRSRQVALGIDEETSYPMWDGTEGDYSVCVDAILGIDRAARGGDSAEAFGDVPSAAE